MSGASKGWGERADRSTQQKPVALEGGARPRQQPALHFKPLLSQCLCCPSTWKKNDRSNQGSLEQKQAGHPESRRGNTATSTRRLSLRPACTCSRCWRDRAPAHAAAPHRHSPRALCGLCSSLATGGPDSNLFPGKPPRAGRRGWNTSCDSQCPLRG